MYTVHTGTCIYVAHVCVPTCTCTYIYGSFVSAVSSDVHSIYAPNDLLDVLMHVRSPNTAVRNGDSSGGVEYGLMKVKLSHKSLYDLVSQLLHSSEVARILYNYKLRLIILSLPLPSPSPPPLSLPLPSLSLSPSSPSPYRERCSLY